MATRKKIRPHKPKHKKGLSVDKLTVVKHLGHYKPESHTGRKKQHHYRCVCYGTYGGEPGKHFTVKTQEDITRFIARGVATCPKCARERGNRKPFVLVHPRPLVVMDKSPWPATFVGYSSAWMEGEW